MEYKIVNLGRDYSGKINDFAAARNSFLSSNEWVLFVDDDEEASEMLLKHLDKLRPTFRYYAIRRINLQNGRYRESWNPDLVPRLVSRNVRFVGRVHESIVPRDPHGIIDFPIIHNHLGASYVYKNYWYQDTPFHRVWLGAKKAMEVIRDR